MTPLPDVIDRSEYRCVQTVRRADGSTWTRMSRRIGAVAAVVFAGVLLSRPLVAASYYPLRRDGP